FSQVIWGSQISLIVGIFSAMVASVLGTAVGLVSGYMGGWVDEVMMRFNDVVLSVPWLVLMIVVAARIGTIDLLGLILVIGLTGWSITARVIRAQVLSVKERLFVERARMIGSSRSHILMRHIFPNAFPLIFANTILTVAVSILSEAVLAFLGLSIYNTVSWGKVINQAIGGGALVIGGNVWWLIVPGLCLVFRGRDLVKVSDLRIRKIRWKEISIIFQGAMNSLNPVRNIGQQIAEPIILHEKVDEDEATNRVGELLELVGINRDRRRDFPHE